jgi:putative phage-type endonuclease
VIEQRLPDGSPNPAWLAARLGKVTASRIPDVVAETKKGWGASRYNYEAELIAERLTGVPAATYTNGAMQWGTEKEPEARDAYAFRFDVEVEEAGFITHRTIAMSGASPDGLVGPVGLVEIKCPNTATHLDTLLGQSVPAKYIDQMQWQMACTSREWCDFASYDPRLPEEMRLFVQRVKRDEQRIAYLEAEVVTFLAEMEDKIAKLCGTYGVRLAEQLRASAEAA